MEYFKSSTSTIILQAIQQISYYDNEFTEADSFTHLTTEYRTYANDNYIEFYSNYNDAVIYDFKVLVTDDNIVYEYYYHQGNTINYFKNDFNKGYLNIYLYSNGSDVYSYSYDYYNCDTRIAEKLTLMNEDRLYYSIKDINKAEYLFIENTKNGHSIRTQLLDDNYIELEYRESVYWETEYSVSYNLKNVTDWLYISEGKLYNDDTEVFLDNYKSYFLGVGDLMIKDEIEELTIDSFGILDDGQYVGPITFEEVVDSRENAVALLEMYYYEYNEESDTFTYHINDLTYSLEELLAFFEELVPSREIQT